MNEYSVDWPLWDEEGLCPEGTPSFSPRLASEILAWARDFTENYSIEAGWPTEAAARSHERQARRLLLLVERELPAEDDVVLGYLETNRRKGL
ncbi:hypothetical protein DEJ28_06250 [Curtobacterium sp. MCPF17_002]|uniref:hypothetical protein n=1 Tax=Curtobacterium sp. MCPF17_002 TaxID=2175645 RepID=UPI0011B6AA03|nr:hypothetical protein [Curtobacterium sp. MCPF17_002]WIB78695.1 hypothetical protein DEJ28_06250 [Curtobacterium sp. MCPF17_002]